MRKPITIFLFIVFCTSMLSAQEQNEYTAYLKQALQAVDNGNDKEFDTNLRYFSVAMEKYRITPEMLTETNLDLYTKCLYEAYVNEIYLEEDLVQKALEFIKYNIEDRPANMVALGMLYEEGLSVPQDYGQAQYWFEKAARKGNPDAMIRLVYTYSSEDEKNDQYWQDTAVEIYKNAAESGETEAMLKLAVAYESPLAFEEADKAKYWLKKAAENGNTKAMYYLGHGYNIGIDGVEDYAKAAHWYEKAAKKGHVKAMYYLGGIYHFGDGNVAQDSKKAKQWFTKACENGYSDACYFE